MNGYHYLVWVIPTFLVYMLTHRLYKKFPSTWFSPIFICPAFVILLLLITHTNYSSYQQATQPITFFLGPIQLAMVVPLYKYASVFRKNLIPIVSGVLIGTCSGIFTVELASLLFHFNPSTVASLAPKSVTAPMAISVSHTLGGLPELTAIFTLMTAMIGMLLGPPILDWLGIKNRMIKGLALGTAASMVGAARAAQWGELEGVMGILGMAISSLLMPFIAPEILTFL